VKAGNYGNLAVPNAIKNTVGKAFDLFASNIAMNDRACFRELLNLTEATIQLADKF